MKRKASAYILLFLIAYFPTHRAAARVHAHTQFEVEIAQEDEALRIQVVTSAALSKHTLMLRKLLVESVAHVRTVTGLNFQDEFRVFFDARPDEHNGLATVIPSDWVIVHSEAPVVGESIGISSDYLKETLVHELAHMIALQHRRGVFRLLSWLFGNTSRPLGLWPRWLHEGSAVWVESTLGGRVGSGYVAYEQRKFADHWHRFSVSPLATEHMDGNFRSDYVDPGHIPYHFGYLLSQELFDREKTLFRDFVQSSARSLGLNFETKLARLGINLNQSFDRVLATSAKTAPKDRLPDLRTVVSGAKKIRGPFQNQGLVSWIEVDDEDQTWLLSEYSGKNVRLPWQDVWGEALEALRTEDQGWLVLVRQLPQDSNGVVRRKLIQLDSSGHFLCEREIGPEVRVREIALRGSTLAWIESLPQGSMALWLAQWRPKCVIEKPQKLLESWSAFERLSTPHITAEGSVYFSRSEGRNSFQESVQNNKFERLSAQVPLSRPLALPQKFCGRSNSCFLLMTHSKEYWGPVLVKEIQGRLEAFKTDLLTTGGDQAAVLGDKILVKQQLWGSDRLVALLPEDFGVPAFRIGRDRDDRRLKVQHEKEFEASSDGDFQSYHFLSSFWPRYWLPELYVYDSGTALGGSSSFSDLTQTWFGALRAGWDTYPQRPYGFADLSRTSLGWGPFSALHVSAYYAPSVLLTSVQDRWGADLSLDWRLRLGASWQSAIAPGVQYVEASGSGLLGSYRHFVPAISIALASSKARNPSHPSFRLSRANSSAQIKLRARYFDDAELYEKITLQAGIFRRVGTQFSLEHGVTRLTNFPASYFEIGGQAPVSTRDPAFMTRGFPTRLIVAKQAMRASMETGVRLVDRLGAMKWNRFRLDDWENVFVVETASFDSFSKASRFRLGRQYFTTAGLRWDFFGQVFHYVNFKTGLGVYKGFGEFGQWSFNLTLSSYLDLP